MPWARGPENSDRRRAERGRDMQQAGVVGHRRVGRSECKNCVAQVRPGEVADVALLALEVDATGLDAMDRRYLTTVAVNYGGGPVGIETIAAALSEPRDAIEEIIEPFLIQQGFIQRTPRGRLLTDHAFRHLGLAAPRRDPAQFSLFGQSDGNPEEG